MENITQADIDNLSNLMDDAYGFFDSDKIPEVMDKLMNTTRDILSTADNETLKQEGIRLFNETNNSLSDVSNLLNDINHTIGSYVNSNI